MRMTKEELLEKYPSWNTNKHDICKVVYGDEPSIKWNKEKYNDFKRMSGTLSNLQAVDAYIYFQYGDYYIYNTLIGKIYITENGDILAGDINIQYNGCNSIYLNKMYGYNALDILRITTNVTGFSNIDGMGSPSRNTKEMDKDIAEKIVNHKMEDYGIGIQKFMEAVRKQYYNDTTNYIMERGIFKK